MSRQKQTTLDAWKTSTSKKQKNEVEDHLDDDDLMDAVEALEQSLDDNNEPTTGLTFEGFDNSLGKEWIYPTNYPVRDYQFNIVKTCLYKNTLVSLPTGLGKTFIAAVVMYNFYRWFPNGKVVFLAPTKPLVAQQISACHKIMGIPFAHQAEITGATMASSKREELWRSCRLFFLTPQCLNNDMTRGVCPINQIKCVVFDEAHKAMGNHAYCQVIQQLQAYGIEFRVLALSATPGSNLQATQQQVEMWNNDADFLKGRKTVDTMHVVNDAAERVVKMCGDFIDRTRNEERLQKVFQVVEKDRSSIPNQRRRFSV